MRRQTKLHQGPSNGVGHQHKDYRCPKLMMMLCCIMQPMQPGHVRFTTIGPARACAQEHNCVRYHPVSYCMQTVESKDKRKSFKLMRALLEKHPACASSRCPHPTPPHPPHISTTITGKRCPHVPKCDPSHSAPSFHKPSSYYLHPSCISCDLRTENGRTGGAFEKNLLDS